jgi:hypothetical protein
MVARWRVCRTHDGIVIHAGCPLPLRGCGRTGWPLALPWPGVAAKRLWPAFSPPREAVLRSAGQNYA